MKKIIAIVLAFELAIISWLVVYIFFKKGSVSGLAVSAINKDTVAFEDDSSQFYELKSGTFYQNTPTDQPLEVRYLINADTFNSPKDFSIEKPEATLRIVALGDSFTYGLFVNTEENWPSQLEKELSLRKRCRNYSNFEVLNLGVWGYDAESSVRRFIKRGLKYSPDLVLWFHTSLGRNSALMYPLSEKYIAEAKAFGSSKEDIEKRNELWLRARNEVIEKAGLDNIYKVARENIERLQSLYSGKILHFYLPGLNNAEKTLLGEVSKEGNTYLLELSDIYSKGGYFKADMHPNPLGYKIIADDLFAYLETNKIINCG